MIDKKQLTEETGIIIEGGEVKLPREKPATEVLADIVQFLIENRYLQESDLPIKSGPTRYLVNDEPVHQNGKEMVRPKKVKGYYLECNYNTKNIRYKINDLIENTDAKS